METILTNIFWAIFGGFLIFVPILYRSRKENWFNGHYGDDSVEFEVKQVEVDFDTKNNYLAKYTITTAFYDDKKQTDFHYNKFVFFDKVGKYNVGDKLFLTKN